MNPADIEMPCFERHGRMNQVIGIFVSCKSGLTRSPDCRSDDERSNQPKETISHAHDLVPFPTSNDVDFYQVTEW